MAHFGKNMWNNRIIKHEKDGTTWHSVHEVFYNEDGSIYGLTEDPITIVGETEAEAVEQAEQILRDIKIPQFLWRLK